MNKKKFVTLFPEAENVHLIKDVGAIPYTMYKKYGYDAYLVCYQNSRNYEYLETVVNGLKVDFLERKYKNSSVNGAVYLWKNAKKIDVLHLFHIKFRTFLWIVVYKMRNKNGKIYLKLDATLNSVDNLKKKGIRGVFKKNTERVFLRKADLVSAEISIVCEKIEKYYNIDIKHIPNGLIDVQRQEKWEPKKNIILTVGRLGTKPKNTELLLEAFVKSAHTHDYELRLVGSVKEDFKPFIEQFLKIHETVSNRIIFVGEITNRERLEEEYRQAKLFALPSRSEGFAFVLVEALLNGCYLIASDQVPALKDISNNYMFGRSVGIKNVDELANLFSELCNGVNEKSEVYYRQANHFVCENFTWEIICSRIERLLNGKN